MSADARTVPPWVDRDAYPFSSRWAELPFGRLHYVDQGAGDTVLFVHGTPTWSFEFRHLVRGLSATHRCLAVDHLGFGCSDRPDDASYTPEAHASRFAAFVEHLGLRQVTLVVHDFGGPIGLPLALQASDRVARVVLLNTWMWSLTHDRPMARRARLAAGFLGHYLYRYLNASLRLLMPGAYGDRRRLTPAIHAQYLAPFRDPDAREQVLWTLARALLGSAAFYDDLWRRRDRLAALPTLIVWGLRDPAFPPRFLDRWQQALPAARVVRLHQSGHWPHEEQPEQVLAAIRAFLAERVQPRGQTAPGTHEAA
jgi:haloalkane dehalogenase